MDAMMAGREYASHLSDADLRLLATAGGAGPDAGVSRLRGDPALLLRLLEHPAVFRAVAATDPASASPASPFLVFAVLVQRATVELSSLSHVPERTGMGGRVPLFDVAALREFLAEPARRLFLAELLASFTRVASGRYWVRTGGRARARRFSELDPVRLAGMLDAVPAAERPGVYRRLGDVALFLTGVFPGYTATRALGPVDAARLLRAARLPPVQLPPTEQQRLATAPAVELLEHLGARWYAAARELAPVPTARVLLAADVGGRFRQARRVLNHLAEKYLFTPGSSWFATPGG